MVVPRTVDDVIATVDACRRHGAPITSRGGGTSLAGQCTNVAVVIDFSKYLNRVLSIDPDARLAVVEPGCNLDRLREEAAEHGLTFGPDPATHDRNTLGGMIGNNSCGVHSVMAEFYGEGPLTADQTVALDILTYDGHRMSVGATSDEELEQIIAAGGRRGEIHRDLRELRDLHEEAIRTGFPDIPRRVSGFNLDRLLPERGFDVAKALVGTEGTCVVVLHATLRLMEAMPKRALVVLGYPDAYTAADHVPLVREHRPVGLEGIDQRLIGYMRKKGLHPDDVDLLPRAGGSSSSSSAPTTRMRPTRRPRAMADAVSKLDDAAQRQALRRPLGGAEALAGARVGARRHGPGAGHAPGPPRLGGRRRAARARRRLPARLPGSARRVRL